MSIDTNVSWSEKNESDCKRWPSPVPLSCIDCVLRINKEKKNLQSKKTTKNKKEDVRQKIETNLLDKRIRAEKFLSSNQLLLTYIEEYTYKYNIDQSIYTSFLLRGTYIKNKGHKRLKCTYLSAFFCLFTYSNEKWHSITLSKIYSRWQVLLRNSINFFSPFNIEKKTTLIRCYICVRL